MRGTKHVRNRLEINRKWDKDKTYCKKEIGRRQTEGSYKAGRR